MYKERELGERRDRVKSCHRRHETEEPDGHPACPVGVPLGPEVHGRVGEHDQDDDQDEVDQQQVRGIARGEPLVGAVMRPGSPGSPAGRA